LARRRKKVCFRRLKVSLDLEGIKYVSQLREVGQNLSLPAPEEVMHKKSKQSRTVLLVFIVDSLVLVNQLRKSLAIRLKENLPN
jgi:hypothetical protein